jgi:hypothetical protein
MTGFWIFMGMNDKELSHIRMMANGIISQSNQKNKWAASVDVKRVEVGANITVALRPGGEKPADPLLELSDLADAIRQELRLERTKLGKAVYATSESTFETEGNPSFAFDVWQL